MGGAQDADSGLVDGVGAAVVDVGGGVQADPGVPVLVGVPAEEPGAEPAGVLDGPEPFGEVRPEPGSSLVRTELGTFSSRDTVSHPAGTASNFPNRYAYAGGNPILYNDPTGNRPTDAVGGGGAPCLDPDDPPPPPTVNPPEPA